MTGRYQQPQDPWANNHNHYEADASRLHQRQRTFSPPPPPPTYGARQPRLASRPSPASRSIHASVENHDPVIHMPIPKTPEQTSPVSPLLQYQETETTAPSPNWTNRHGNHIPSSYSYPDYSAPQDMQYAEYDAYEDPARVSYTPAAYEEACSSLNLIPGGADRSYIVSGAYQYNERETGSEYTGYTCVDLSQNYEQMAEEKGIDEKSVAKFYEYDHHQQQRLRFGVPPEGPTRRRGTKLKKKVILTDGNLVVDLPIPSNLRLGFMQNVMDEMRSVRYTAVTCDADDFEGERYSLRQNWSGRETELLVAITMYNEDEVLLARTLYGVMQGISHLCSRKNSKTWGQDAWKKVVVVIISDGRKNISPQVLDCLAALGVYQDGVMKSRVKDKNVTAHIFEYTTTFALDPELRFRYPDKGIVPTQIIFCLKEKNAKKINSHRWFFNAFGKVLQPNVCVLLDVGTRPGVKSLYHIWKAFDVNSNVAGACGEIAAYKGRYWSSMINPLVAAQNFEYKMSNLLDKPWESICGYISVLPGAFSAYRYIALQNDEKGIGPLASYFKGEVLSGADADIFTSNMYLAEDRILCFELMAKANASWVLKYVKSAVGETDVPDSLSEFIMQRRRWLNGSFFAAVYALTHLPQVLQSGHGFFRKSVLVFESMFNLLALVFAWFGVANYYLFFYILTTALEDPSFKIPFIHYWNYVMHFCYATALASVFILAMGNKPKASQWKYKLVTIFFSFLTVYMVSCAVICAVRATRDTQDQLFIRMVVSLAATYGIYFAASFFALDPWHMFTSFIPYVLLSPMYLNILTIYAFCNLDDISWGTKDDGTSEDLGTVKEADASSNGGGNMVELEILAEPGDVNTAYMDALNNIKRRKTPLTPAGRLPTNSEKDQMNRDYYANVRTNVLLTWVLTNGLLMIFILSDTSAKTIFSNSSSSTDGGSVGQSSRTKVYMSFILIFVAATSSVRFLGSMIYLITRIFTH
ncbi:hypothetical protein FRB94_012053 [Tulasnella sp. JGI-2019a]|nr:hypothetical protein FRB94_012053 [Tulasnella sp. JGI-2019a]KAG9014537.1 hypothetical protein FRB93_013662 [Tulasnella sp. JGI-2019a]